MRKASNFIRPDASFEWIKGGGCLFGRQFFEVERVRVAIPTRKKWD